VYRHIPQYPYYIAHMADESEAFSLLREAQRRARHLVVGGALWIVFEMPASPYDRRHAPSLIFESDDTVRRVRNFPATWRELSDEDLFALSWTV
jgi:hypothetical protein